jgi:hypothetical protein
MKYLTLPRIEYPATREFKGRYFNKLAYAGAFVSLVTLAMFNGE